MVAVGYTGGDNLLEVAVVVQEVDSMARMRTEWKETNSDEEDNDEVSVGLDSHSLGIDYLPNNCCCREKMRHQRNCSVRERAEGRRINEA